MIRPTSHTPIHNASYPNPHTQAKTIWHLSLPLDNMAAVGPGVFFAHHQLKHSPPLSPSLPHSFRHSNSGRPALILPLERRWWWWWWWREQARGGDKKRRTKERGEWEGQEGSSTAAAAAAQRHNNDGQVRKEGEQSIEESK